MNGTIYVGQIGHKSNLFYAPRAHFSACGAIKIGRTEDLPRRWRELSYTYGKQIEILYRLQVEYPVCTEWAVQRILAQWRIPGLQDYYRISLPTARLAIRRGAAYARRNNGLRRSDVRWRPIEPHIE